MGLYGTAVYNGSVTLPGLEPAEDDLLRPLAIAPHDQRKARRRRRVAEESLRTALPAADCRPHDEPRRRWRRAQGAPRRQELSRRRQSARHRRGGDALDSNLLPLLPCPPKARYLWLYLWVSLVYISSSALHA